MIIDSAPMPTSMENLIKHKQLRSRAWLVVRDSKKSSLRAGVSSLMQHTSPMDVWGNVNKIKGI